LRIKCPIGGDLNAFAPRVDKVRYKCCISRKKAGRNMQILDDNYYA
jgi:hypothetical protein